MTPLRFRAWHKEEMKPANLIMVRRGCTRFKSYESDKMWEIGEIMQSTGLKDKRGVEIFEGDIVRVQTRCANPGKWEAEYRNEQVELVREELTHDQPGMVGYYTYPAEDGEIIGNIYEHPHLLHDPS